MKIGIGVLTHKRNNALKEVLPAIRDTVTSDNVDYFVSINQSDDRESDEKALIIANEHKFSLLIGENSVSKGKNRILKYLYAGGVDYAFIIEDDFIPQKKGWDEIYANNMRDGKIHHIQHVFEFEPLNDMPIFTKTEKPVKLNIFKWVNGSLMIFSKLCLETLGGLDERFNVFGHEHIEYMERAKMVGLHSNHRFDPTRRFFFDLYDARGLFKEMPKIGSSISMTLKMKYIRSNDSILKHIRNSRNEDGVKRELIKY